MNARDQLIKELIDEQQQIREMLKKNDYSDVYDNSDRYNVMPIAELVAILIQENKDLREGINNE